MFTSEIAIALTIGVVLSLLFSEFFGHLPGGLVVPGFLALSWNHPYSLLSVLFISILTYCMVKLIMGHFIILFGRRKFAAMLLVGIGFSVGLNQLIAHLPWVIPPLTGVGIIVPGLIANCFQKQGFLTTVASMAILSSITIVGIKLYHLYL